MLQLHMLPLTLTPYQDLPRWYLTTTLVKITGTALILGGSTCIEGIYRNQQHDGGCAPWHCCTAGVLQFFLIGAYLVVACVYGLSFIPLHIRIKKALASATAEELQLFAQPSLVCSTTLKHQQVLSMSSFYQPINKEKQLSQPYGKVWLTEEKTTSFALEIYAISSDKKFLYPTILHGQLSLSLPGAFHHYSCKAGICRGDLQDLLRKSPVEK